jgi:hypothetical protein
MQRAADFHYPIADTRFAEAACVVHNATAFDAAVDMFDAHATARDALIRGFLRPREGAAPGLPGWHDDRDLVERERQEAQILEQPAARGQRVGRRIGNSLIVGTAGVRLTQKENRERHVDEQHVFHRVVLFLAAITARLLSRILRALDASFGPIVPKRGRRVPALALSRADGTWSVTRPPWSRWPRPPRYAGPMPSRTGWGHPPACAGLPAAPPRGHESIDGPCFDPSRTAAPVPPGGGKFSSRPG